MNKVYIFDVDGTLTPSRLPMTDEFKKFFKTWIQKNTFYLVTGSDLPKLQEQMDGMEIHADGIFTCCGNQFWEVDPAVHPKHCDLIYDNKFEMSTKLKNALEVILMSSQYPHRYGNHIEDRGSMINFSVVGRNCTQEQRENFFKWDNEKGERRKISLFIKQKFKNLDAVIGGQISIDIYPKGMDKSQILQHVQSNFELPFGTQHQYIFIGDRIKKGGNDYPLAKLMKETHDCLTFETEGWKNTQKILENLID
tara:strand:+ start:155 stop:910 length:756 start_codon:yes stop_codon:yes gene_type:complete